MVPPGPVLMASSDTYRKLLAEETSVDPGVQPRTSMAPKKVVVLSDHNIAVPPVPCAADASMRVVSFTNRLVALGNAGTSFQRAKNVS